MAAQSRTIAIPAPRPDLDRTAVLGVERPVPWLCVAVLDGEIDLRTAAELRTRLVGLLTENDPLVLVVDMTGVDFLAASGLSALVEVRERAVESAVALRLVATGRAVLRPLEITGLRATFDIRPDRASALGRG